MQDIDTEVKRKREDVKSTPRNEEFLPEFGCKSDDSIIEIKKIRSENDRKNPRKETDKISFSGRPVRSNSKRTSFEVELATKEKWKMPMNILSSSNSSRSKSKEITSFALTMNPISTTNFKYSIGNLPIKVSRDDDMLFSFRNQVMTNRSIKDVDTSQLPESINSKHGEITYLLTSLEDSIGTFLQSFKMCLEDIENSSDDTDSEHHDRSYELDIKDNSTTHGHNIDDDENSLVTLLDIRDNDIDDQFDDFIDEEQFNERSKHEEKLNISDSINKSKSVEPMKIIEDHKNHESSLNFSTLDPKRIPKSSTTPKSRGKKIKPQISVFKSAKSTRVSMHSSKKSIKSKHITKAADRKIRNLLANEGNTSEGNTSEDRRRVGRITKKSMDRICSNPNENSGGKFLITSPDNSNSGRGAIKFFSLKKNSSRNAQNKTKFTSVSTNRYYIKKSNILHTSKDGSSGRLDVSSKSQNNRNDKHISFYPAPQSLRIKREDGSRLEVNDNTTHLKELTVDEPVKVTTAV